MSINSYQRIVADVLGIKFDENTDVFSFCSMAANALQTRKDSVLEVAEEIKKVIGKGGLFQQRYHRYNR